VFHYTPNNVTPVSGVYYKGPELDYKYVEVSTGTGINRQVYLSGYLWCLKGISSGTYWSSHITGTNSQFDFSFGSGALNSLVSAGTFNGQMYVELV
jgi:hypothetical protein